MTSTLTAWTSPHGTPLPEIGSRTLLMGILNVTPDSFSDGGIWTQTDDAINHAHAMVTEGADIIDIGGESTRPGAEPVSADEEIARVIPVICRLKQELPHIPISIDSYKAEVAAAAISAGADLINDVWGLRHGLAGKPANALSPMAEVAAQRQCPVILMHNRSHRHYDDFWKEILADLERSLDLARAAGIEERQIWLDPGFGFGKKPHHNLEVLKHLDRIVALGFPVMLGTSRKSTLGLILDSPTDDRLPGNTATAVWGVSRGCQMIRVHDVGAIKPFIQVTDAIQSGIDFSHG